MYYLFIDNELSGYFPGRLHSHGGTGTGSAHNPSLAALACDSFFIHAEHSPRRQYCRYTHAKPDLTNSSFRFRPVQA